MYEGSGLRATAVPTAATPLRSSPSFLRWCAGCRAVCVRAPSPPCSSCKVPAAVGVVRVVREAYPDHFAFDKKSKYYDERRCVPNG